jgi:hypothetical protein
LRWWNTNPWYDRKYIFLLIYYGNFQRFLTGTPTPKPATTSAPRNYKNYPRYFLETLPEEIEPEQDEGEGPGCDNLLTDLFVSKNILQWSSY